MNEIILHNKQKYAAVSCIPVVLLVFAVDHRVAVEILAGLFYWLLTVNV